MYTIKVEAYFSSAHSLRGYKGKCESLHGHNWKVKATVASSKLDKLGMVMDFGELKMKLKEVLNALDHRNLNDIDYFKKVNPTSENIAKYILDKLSYRLQATPRLRSGQAGYRLKEVTVWETDTSSATYCK
jgi:6-pyruvoyltetrahydropterin/6-carboxytetrahydropterin synthase